MLGGVRSVAGERSRLDCAGDWEIRCLDFCLTLDVVGVSDLSRLASIEGGLVGSTVNSSIGRA